MQPITVALFGISGSGKGTQAQLLEKALREKDPSHNVVHPEMGALMRSFMTSGTSLAGKINEIVSSGGLVPSFSAIYLLASYMDKNFTGGEHLILDGTCRRPEQSRALDEMMRLWGRKDLHAFVFKLSRETAKKRLQGRGRADDLIDEVIEKRFSWYEEWVVPSFEELRKLGWTINEIDGEPDIETIHKNILSVLRLA